MSRQEDADAGIEKYLEQLTKVTTTEDLLEVVRNAASWALEAHRADVKERKDREPRRDHA